MKSFIFVQWKKPTDASRYVIDGNFSEYSGAEDQDYIMQLLANVPKYKEILNNKNRADLSPSFRLSRAKIQGSVMNFIEGNFKETDVAGRKLVFIFATYETSPIKIVELLKEYSTILGVTPHDTDLEEIKKTKKNNQEQTSNNIVIWVIIVVIILLLSFILQNLQNK